jgi:hypothetical protein
MSYIVNIRTEKTIIVYDLIKIEAPDMAHASEWACYEVEAKYKEREKLTNEGCNISCRSISVDGTPAPKYL